MFGIPGRGDYRMQPVFVEDFAAMTVASVEGNEDVLTDAVGPEIYTFMELLETLKMILKSRCLILPLPPTFALAAAKAIGILMGDVMLTSDEVKGLMRNLLVSSRPPSCSTRLSEWVRQNAASVGVRYASELARRR